MSYQIPEGYAIFIRNTSAHYADKIFDGTKSIETRTAPVLDSCRGRWVKVVKTETREIIGEIYIYRGNPVEYDSYESFDRHREFHQVPKGSRFDWNGKKVGYHILGVRKYDTPIPVPKDAKKYGRIAVRVD